MFIKTAGLLVGEPVKEGLVCLLRFRSQFGRARLFYVNPLLSKSKMLPIFILVAFSKVSENI